MKKLPITQMDPQPGLIDLGNGNPDLSLLPLKLLHHAAEKFFLNNDPRPLQYGAEQGNGYFRHSLAECLADIYETQSDPDIMFVTSGVSSALHLICSLFTRHGDVIFAEEPTYFLALRIFRDHGLEVVPVPIDESGICLDRLEVLLKKHSPKFLYTIPAFQNPSGRTLSRERRVKLVELTGENNLLLVADEVYQLLAFDQSPPPPFTSFLKDARHVISMNSFSKILAPGLRLGWLQAHETVIRRLTGCGLLDSGGGMNPFTSAVVRQVVESGDLSQHIQFLKKEYSIRLQTMHTALRRNLPMAEFTRPEGGFFYWVRIPGCDAGKLRLKAKAANVDFRPGDLFSSCGGLREYIRLSFCFYRSDEIVEGIKRLRECLAF